MTSFNQILTKIKWRSAWQPLLFFIFILFSYNAFAIEPQLQFEHISIVRGLSNKKVQCIAEDLTGFLWIGTQYGLNRYDGTNFKVFKSDPTTKNSIIDNNISCLQVDNAGFLWIGTKRGLNRLDPLTNRFSVVKIFENQNIQNHENEILELTKDLENNIWVLSKKGISCIRSKSLSCENFPFSNDKSSPGQKFNSIIFKGHSLWLGSESGLFEFDTKTKKFKKENIQLPAIFKISGKQDSTIVLTHSKGYSKYNYISKKLSNPAFGLEISVSCLLKTKFSGFWIGSQEACLFQVEGNFKKQYCPNLSNPESIKSKSISCLFEDESGILWIGTSDQGLFKMDPIAQFFKTHRLQIQNHEYLTNPNVTAILEDGQKTLWIGSDKGLFSAENGSEIFKSWTFEQKALTNVTSLSSSKDEILVGSNEGLFLIKADKITKIQIQKTPVNEEVNSISIDEKGNVWIGTAMAGVCLWKRNEKTFTWLGQKENQKTDAGHLLSNTIKKILCDKSGRVWIGTDRGLNLIEPGNLKISSFVHEHGNNLSIPHGAVSPMFVDEKQNLWLASSGGGVCKLHIGSQDFTIYNEFNGLSSNYISKIIAQNENSLWISTEKGINVLDLKTSIITKYGLSDGLLFEMFNENSGWKTTDGKIMFGCTEGLVAFESSKIIRQNIRPKVILNDLFIHNKRIELKKPINQLEEIALTHRQNYFSLSFSVINFHLPNRIKVFYRLVGLERDWIDAANKREISYSNLEFKSYTFQIKAINNESIESKVISVPIVIFPPYWKTDSFKGISVVSLLLLVLVFYRSRVSIIAKRNKRLERLVEMRTSELQETNNQIEFQAKEILEEKLKLEDSNRKLWSNIEYGNKIQRATLPEISEIQQFIPETFVVYLPKDIVSGDFYWYVERQNKLLIAAVDCTGHGVPGAFMSLIGYEKLNKIVAEQGIESPALILDSLEQKLQTLLKQDDLEAGTTDGMELALVAIEKNFSSLTFAGAHRPLYLVRNGELTEYKGDSFGVGGGLVHMKKGQFSQQNINLQKGDMVYLFSDGFVGQFDSETGKKYFTKNFRELLKTVSVFEADKQQLLIQHELRSFAKNSPQIDDILVIGFRIP